MKSSVKTSAKVTIAAIFGASTVYGVDKLLHDSPVHFMVEGTAPVGAEGWKCAPEGGIVGAQMVCHPVMDESTKTE